MNAIEINRVRKHYGKKVVVKNATASIAAGQRVALVGRSGCGKSTLLRTIVGLETPDSGEIKLLGQPVLGLPPPSEVAYLAQRPILLPWMSALSNALLPLTLKRNPTASDIAVARHLFESFGLRDFESFRPQNLSGGMRQRVALIQALALNPEILILDEPFNALDDVTRRLITVELAKWIAHSKCTLLMVTHSFEDAAYLCDRVVVWSASTGDDTKGELVDIDAIPPFAATLALSDFSADALDDRKRHVFQKYIEIESPLIQGH